MFHGEKGNTAEMNRKTEVLSRETVKKEKKKKEWCFRNLWNYIKMSNRHVTGIPEENIGAEKI